MPNLPSIKHTKNDGNPWISLGNEPKNVGFSMTLLVY
jgi:hypothetical protein